MLKINFLLSIIIGISSYSQSVYTLENNNASAYLTDGGSFFENISTGVAGYEIPKNSGSTAIFSMGLWMAAVDVNAQIHSSITQYNSSSELFAGPISDSYGSSYYTSTFLTSMWPITKAEIDNHIANYLVGGYTVPAAIANWPGNGNSTEGVSANLAPYIDVNINGTYDPAGGDYPAIQGDEAVFVILNDENGTHAINPGSPLGVEVHVMMYQFSTTGDVDNTTFFNVKVYNRRSENYANFKLGIFADFDLGNPLDDFCGSDSAKKYMFAYNGDANDEGATGGTPYGTNPPAIGIVSLSHELESAIFIPSLSNNIMEYDNSLNGLQPSGQPFTHLNGFDTKFVYSDNPDSTNSWNENSLGNPSGDRKSVMSLYSVALNPGDFICADFAVVYNRSLTASNLENAQGLDAVVDNIQSYYDTNIQPCQFVNVGINESATIKFEVYPNPSEGQFTISVNEEVQIIIYDISGKIVHNELLASGNSVINLEGLTGMYMLKAIGGNGTHTQKIKLIH